MIQKIQKNRSLLRILKEFELQADLVYFGDIKNDDEIAVIQGITFDKSRRDSHYLHGNVSSRDVSTLIRRTELKHPHHKSDTYEWTIMKFDLSVSDMPHIFIDAHHSDELLYKNIFTKFASLRSANYVLSQINSSFTSFFSVFSQAQDQHEIPSLLNDTALQTLLTYYSNYDIEVIDSSLFIYKNGPPEHAEELMTMLNEGLWLASHLEYTKSYVVPQLSMV